MKCFLKPVLGLSLMVLLACGGGGGGQTQPGYAPPPTPSGLTVASGSWYGQVELSWNLDWSQVDWLTLQARKQGGSYTVAEDHVPPVSPRTFSLPADFPELTSVDFRICSNAHALQSGWSNAATFTTGIMPATSIGAAWTGDGVEVTWDHPSRVATGIRLERTEVQNGVILGWSTVPGVALADTLFIDHGVTDVTSYLYRVTYTTGAQTSPSAVMDAPVKVPLQVPTGLQATLLPGGDIRLTWVNHSTHAVSLSLLRAQATQTSNNIPRYATLTTDQTSFTDLAPAPGYYTYALYISDGYLTQLYSAHAILYVPGPAGDLSFASTLHAMPEVGYPYWYFQSDAGRWGFMASYHDSSFPAFGWMTDQGPAMADYPIIEGTFVYPGPMVDAQGKVHILSFTVLNPSGRRVDHLWHDGTAWATEAAGSGSTYANFGVPSALLDAQGHVHALCPGQDGATLHHLSNASGAWTDETLALPCSTYAQTNSLAVDPAGNVHASADEGALVADRTSDGIWTQEAIPLDGGSLGNGHLTLAALAGDVLVAFYTNGPATPVFAVSRRSGTWGTPVQLASWNYGDNQKTRIVTARDGSRLAMASYDGHGGIAVATTTDGITWKHATIPTSPTCGDTFNLGFSPTGKLWVDVASDYEAVGFMTALHMCFQEP